MSTKPLNKIIVIEDEVDILTIIKFALERIGHLTVEYCNHSEKALQQIETFVPDLVLMDMMMPGMDGLTVLNALRQTSNLAHIPIIFMTARAQPEEIKHYLRAGAIGVISKPFDPLTLPAKLQELWNEQNKEINNE